MLSFQCRNICFFALLCLLFHLQVIHSIITSSSYLSYHWDGGVYTDLGRTIKQFHETCHPELYNHGLINTGLGSDLHVWSQALCNSMQYNVSLNLVNYDWIWKDVEFCKDTPEFNNPNPLQCYFNIQNPCPSNFNAPHTSYKNKIGLCSTYIQDEDSKSIFRAAAMEYIFSNISKKLINETEHVAKLLFDEFHYTPKKIPKDMITVHVRWGDKHKEMDLVQPQEYMAAILELVKNESIAHPHVHLVTESADAVKEIRAAVHNHDASWGFTHYGESQFSQMEQMGKSSNGKFGRISLINLLIALEAKYYIITTGSNWSRLINELRKNIIDQRCNYCTKMVDLRQGKTYHNWRK